MKTILALLLTTVSAFADLDAWNSFSNAVIRVGQIITGNGNSSFSRVYNVMSFGATGNGSTDDTAAIQSAINACDNASGGIVFFPNGTYKLTGTNGLVVADANNSHGGQHYISLLGESLVSTVLSYAGPTNGFAVVLLSDKYVSIETMTISRSGAMGTTTGVLLTGKNSGTQSNGGYMNNVSFSGFGTGLSAGPGSGFPGTSSEWVFDSVSFNSCNLGFQNSDFNGLDFMFRMVQAISTTTVIGGSTAGITIDGGSFSGVGTGFYCRNGGLFAIRNVRSENETGPFVDSHTTVLVENCLVNVSDTNTPAIALLGGSATIRMCQLGGYIGATNTQSLDVEDTGLNAQSVATIGGTHGQLTYFRNYQTQGQTSTAGAMFSDSIQINGQTPSRAAAFDSSTNLTSVTTTLTELNLLSGTSSPLHYGAVGNGITNSAGTITASLAAGGNITFATNSGQITISASGTGGSTPFANPTASVGLSTVNGSSTNAMRADAAPALSQSIAPTWTGAHVFQASSGNPITVTNSATTQVGIVVNGFSGQTNDIVQVGAGGTNFFKVDKIGTLFSGVGTSLGRGLNIGGSTSSGVDLYVNSGAFRMYKGDGSFAAADLGVVGSVKIVAGSDLELQGGGTFFQSPSANAFQFGASASSPSAQTVGAASGSGTDKAGGNIQYQGGTSTGTGTGGVLDMATALTAEASSSSANSQSIRAHYKPKFVALTHTTATSIETFSLAANKLIGGTITALCYATNSTPHLQALTSRLTFQAVAVSTTITGTISQVDGTTAADSGTLTCTYTLLDNGNNTFSIQANANSSLSSPTERCKLVVTALNGNAAVTITDP